MNCIKSSRRVSRICRIHRSMLSTLVRTMSSIILSEPDPIEEYFPKSRAVLRSIFGKKITQASQRQHFHFHHPRRGASCDFSRVCFFCLRITKGKNPCATFVDRSTLVEHASFLSANERGKKPSCPTVYTKNHAQLKLGAPNIGAPNKTPCATFVDRSTLVEHASFLSVNERGKKPSCPTGYKKNPCPTKVGCSKHWRSKALQT